MTRTAIIAAMAGELKPLVRGWRHERANGVDLWSRRRDESEWIAACAGAGTDAAARAFVEVEKRGPVDEVISAGWAGALREELAPGRAYWVAGVIDARTGERFLTADKLSHPSRKDKDAARVGHPGFWLVTSFQVASAHEKQRLTATYEAAIVDMEAAAIARLAAERAIPFFCVKGISDGYNDQLPDFNSFISTGGRFRLAQFIVFALLRPSCWPALVRMGENSKKAVRAIAASVQDLLEAQGHIRKRNDYPNNEH